MSELEHFMVQPDYSTSGLFRFSSIHSKFTYCISWFTVIGTRGMNGRDERNMVEAGLRCPALVYKPWWLH